MPKHPVIHLLVMYLYLCPMAVADVSSNEEPRAALDNEFPSFVSLASIRPLYRVFCSGTIITGILILTTANCLSKYPRGNTVILVGSNRALHGNRYTVAAWMTYTEWLRRNNKNHKPDGTEIGIIEVSRRIEFTPSVNLAQMPLEYNVPIHDLKVTVLSWPDARGYVDLNLIAGNVSLTSYDGCKSRVHGPTRVRVMEERLFCSVPGPHLTKIDEGGPVIVNNRLLVGINYWRQTRTSFPKVNMHINYVQFKHFITSITDTGLLTLYKNPNDS
ncbi:hypothetical protein QAD02_001121 [Eretmocerus hayati]|uniref:Uncharacterized protein n=1 Tax=Eretmocerus hayati TaxID=131215 RepID=A0ACC2NFI5_9HYME|nr:hypothetical protein QAD02_001121 [Eretmocerus hayati]